MKLRRPKVSFQVWQRDDGEFVRTRLFFRDEYGWQSHYDIRRPGFANDHIDRHFWPSCFQYDLKPPILGFSSLRKVQLASAAYDRHLKNLNVIDGQMQLIWEF